MGRKAPKGREGREKLSKESKGKQNRICIQYLLGRFASCRMMA